MIRNNAAPVLAIAALVLQMSSAPAVAQQGIGPCTQGAAAARTLTPDECARLAEGSRQPRQMIYQNSDVQVLLIRTGTVRAGSLVEATLILNFPASSSDTGKKERSLLRRQRIDCEARTGSIVEERSFAGPVGRGAPVSSRTPPSTPPAKPERGSIDAAVIAALCAGI